MMKRPDYLVSGDLARLIPVAIKPELRNTCVTCSMLMAVEEFADILLSPLGAPIGKRAKIHVWVEPVFKTQKSDNKDRPDAQGDTHRCWKASSSINYRQWFQTLREKPPAEDIFRGG